MKYLWMGLAAVSAILIGVSTASATTLTSPNGAVVPAGNQITLSLENSLLFRAGFTSLTCTQSSIAVNTENTGGSSETVRGPVESLTYSNCNATVHVLKKGSLEFHVIGGGPNGTVTSTGTEVTYASLGTSCTYGTANTPIGTLTGSKNTGSGATLDIKVNLFKTAGGFLCASPAAMEGSYVVTKPEYLDVD